MRLIFLLVGVLIDRGYHWAERWMVKLICENHNHSLAKSFIEHPYVGQLIEDENIIIGDMTKSMVKSKNILFTLKEHNANNERRRCCT